MRTDPPIDLEAERKGRHAPKDLLIHTHEGSWLEHAFSARLEAKRDDWLGRARRRIRLVVLRDPFNLFASRTRMGCRLSAKVAPRIWKQHARGVVPYARP